MISPSESKLEKKQSTLPSSLETSPSRPITCVNSGSLLGEAAREKDSPPSAAAPPSTEEDGLRGLYSGTMDRTAGASVSSSASSLVKKKRKKRRKNAEPAPIPSLPPPAPADVLTSSPVAPLRGMLPTAPPTGPYPPLQEAAVEAAQGFFPQAPMYPPTGMPPLAPGLPAPASSGGVYPFTPEVSPALCALVGQEVLPYLMPSLQGLNKRRDQLQRLAQYITEAIRVCGEKEGVRYGEIRFFLFGSVNMRTVLPDGDNDITIEIDGLLPESQHVAPVATTGRSGVLPPLTTESSYGNKEGTLQLTTNVDGRPALAAPPVISVTAGDLLARVKDVLVQGKTPIYVDALVLAEVRVLKLSMEGSSYDITISQFGGINCVRFLHEMDAVIGGQHLLKSTLLLLKSWCSYEAHILGGQGGYIGSYAATCMLISMLNTVEFLEDVEEECPSEEGTTESGAPSVSPYNPSFRTAKTPLSPLALMCRFLKFYRYFDFDKYCVTAFGPLPLTEISATPYDMSQLEVDAAHSDPSTINHSIDKENLGLTAEGVSAIGHLIRRRQAPFLTVSGMKHLLHEMNSSRWTQREEWYSVRRTGLFPSRSEPSSIQLSVPGNTEADGELICPSCNSCAFPVRCMNVMDPLRWSSNMVRGVCRNHLQRIQRALQEGLSMFATASAELLVGQPPVMSPPPLSTTHSTTSSFQNSEAGNANPYLAPFAAEQRYEEIVPGYPSPLSQCTAQEVNVLQYLFDHTIRTIRRNSAVNCPWRREEDAPGTPQCATCLQPSFFCTPCINGMCQPQCVFDDRMCPSEILEERRRQGPLGEAVVPPLSSSSMWGGMNGGKNHHNHHNHNNNNNHHLHHHQHNNNMNPMRGPFFPPMDNMMPFPQRPPPMHRPANRNNNNNNNNANNNNNNANNNNSTNNNNGSNNFGNGNKVPPNHHNNHNNNNNNMQSNANNGNMPIYIGLRGDPVPHRGGKGQHQHQHHHNSNNNNNNNSPNQLRSATPTTTTTTAANNNNNDNNNSNQVSSINNNI